MSCASLTNQRVTSRWAIRQVPSRRSYSSSYVADTRLTRESWCSHRAKASLRPVARYGPAKETVWLVVQCLVDAHAFAMTPVTVRHARADEVVHVLRGRVLWRHVVEAPVFASDHRVAVPHAVAPLGVGVADAAHEEQRS